MKFVGFALAVLLPFCLCWDVSEHVFGISQRYRDNQAFIELKTDMMIIESFDPQFRDGVTMDYLKTSITRQEDGYMLLFHVDSYIDMTPDTVANWTVAARLQDDVSVEYLTIAVPIAHLLSRPGAVVLDLTVDSVETGNNIAKIRYGTTLDLAAITAEVGTQSLDLVSTQRIDAPANDERVATWKFSSLPEAGVISLCSLWNENGAFSLYCVTRHVSEITSAVPVDKPLHVGLIILVAVLICLTVALPIFFIRRRRSPTVAYVEVQGAA